MSEVMTSARPLDRTATSLPESSLCRRLWYDATYLLSMASMTLGFSFRTEGRGNVPSTGPALLVANHQSFLDPLVVGISSSRQLCYLARKSLFRHSGLAWLIRSLNAVPIDQEGIGKEGIKAILAQLRAGQAVVVFPEGERTWDGQMQALRPGIHLLIKRTQAPIVPVGIAGAYDAWPRWQSYPIPAPLFWPACKGAVAVSVGKPLDAGLLAGLPRDQALKALFEELKKAHSRAERLRRK